MWIACRCENLISNNSNNFLLGTCWGPRIRTTDATVSPPRGFFCPVDTPCSGPSDLTCLLHPRCVVPPNLTRLNFYGDASGQAPQCTPDDPEVPVLPAKALPALETPETQSTPFGGTFWPATKQAPTPSPLPVGYVPACPGPQGPPRPPPWLVKCSLFLTTAFRPDVHSRPPP